MRGNAIPNILRYWDFPCKPQPHLSDLNRHLQVTPLAGTPWTWRCPLLGTSRGQANTCGQELSKLQMVDSVQHKLNILKPA